MIEIVYKDDVHLQVKCDSSVAQELTDFFTFDVPGAKFMPAVRNRVWDGKIRLFNSVTRTVYTGLKDYIVDFCADLWFNIHMLNVIDALNDKIENLVDSANNTAEKIVEKINDFLVDFLG